MVKIVESIVKKIIIIMIIIQATFIPISSEATFEEIIQQGDKFLDEGKDNQYIKDEDGNILYENGKPVKVLNEELLQETIESVYNILLAIGVAVSVGTGAVMGIKFMAGSVEEQAKVKEMLIPYVIGCIVVFGGFGIWKIVMTLAGDIFI